MQVPSTEKTSIRRTLTAYQQALNARSFAQLEPLLAPNISVGGADPALSRAGLQGGSAWAAFRVVDTQILSLKPTSDGPEAQLALYSNKMVMTLKMGFDATGRIRSIDAQPLFKIPEPTVPNVLTSPFVVSGGLMFVKATVNGRVGYMLLDTGSSSLLLNPKYFDSGSRQAMGVTATVNGIRKSGAAVKVTSLEWRGLRTGNVDGELHDFSTMEKPAITPLLGAISHTELKNCAIAFDWKHKTIQVFATKPDGTKKSPLPEPPPMVRLPFSYYLHLPLFTARIGGIDYPMLFDSGAQWNLLPSLTGAEKHFHVLGRLSGFSDGGRAVANSSAIGAIDQTFIAGVPFRDMPYAIFQIPYFPNKGFLGAPLLQISRTEINFRSKQISIWP
ncbi:hypothetical protein BH09VER1_BH09VER1_53960 [soil metagenome]